MRILNNHDKIVNIYDMFEGENTIYLVIELVNII